MDKILTSGTSFIDEYGRERIFNGVNLCDKGWPGDDGKLNFVACAGSEAVKAGAHAGNILKEISAICGGKGGGRPDSAMSGGRDLDKIDEALARVEEILAGN